MMLNPLMLLASALLTTGAAASPEVFTLVSIQCDRCGLMLAGIDAEAGHTRCRECRASGEIVIGIDHGNGPDVATTTLMRRTESSYEIVVAHHDPIEVACPACRAQPGAACDRRTMGRRWLYHRARVDAAEGAG